MGDKKFEIKIKPSNISKEEKRKLLWSCFEILFSNHKKENKNVNSKKHGKQNKNGKQNKTTIYKQ